MFHAFLFNARPKYNYNSCTKRFAVAFGLINPFQHKFAGFERFHELICKNAEIRQISVERV